MDIFLDAKKHAKKFAGKGLSDIVKESIDTVSGGRIKQCGGCKKRQALLNKMLKFDDVIEDKMQGKVLKTKTAYLVPRKESLQ